MLFLMVLVINYVLVNCILPTCNGA